MTHDQLSVEDASAVDSNFIVCNATIVWTQNVIIITLITLFLCYQCMTRKFRLKASKEISQI